LYLLQNFHSILSSFSSTQFIIIFSPYLVLSFFHLFFLFPIFPTLVLSPFLSLYIFHYVLFFLAVFLLIFPTFSFNLPCLLFLNFLLSMPLHFRTRDRDWLQHCTLLPIQVM
jgi:hypothetical protein